MGSQVRGSLDPSYSLHSHLSVCLLSFPKDEIEKAKGALSNLCAFCFLLPSSHGCP